MKKLFLMLCAVAGLTVQGWAFDHPGLLSSTADLDFIKAKVNTGQQPWKSGYDRMVSEHSYLSHSPRPHASWAVAGGGVHPTETYTDLMGDGEVVYGCALQWYIAGDQAFANKAIQIMDAWSSTFVSVSGSNEPLDQAWGWQAMILGAEIIRHTGAGWSTSGINSFKDLLSNRVMPSLLKREPFGNNWESWNIYSMISISVFTDDQSKYDKAVSKYKTFLTAYIKSSGESGEICRDMWHVQAGMGPLALTAEIAYQQGDDSLYTYSNNRLLLGYEFFIPFMQVMGGASYTCTINMPDRIIPIYEVAYNHYKNRLGVSTPNLGSMVNKVRSEGYDYMGWGTLTHVDLQATPVTPTIHIPQISPNGFNELCE